jgi:hypothetical protein
LYPHRAGPRARLTQKEPSWFPRCVIHSPNALITVGRIASLSRPRFAPGSWCPQPLFLGQLPPRFGVFFANQGVFFGVQGISAEIFRRRQLMGLAEVSLGSPHLLPTLQTNNILFFDNFIQRDGRFLHYFGFRLFPTPPDGCRQHGFATAQRRQDRIDFFNLHRLILWGSVRASRHGTS